MVISLKLGCLRLIYYTRAFGQWFLLNISLKIYLMIIRKDDKTFTEVRLLCKLNAKAHIRSVKHAYHTWETLEKTYTDIGLNRKRSLTTSYLRQCLSDNQLLDLYVAQIMELSFGFREMGSLVYSGLASLTQNFSALTLSRQSEPVSVAR